MSLSDYEKEVLENLEQQFEPKPEPVESSLPVKLQSKSKPVASPRRIVISVFLILVGLVLLLLGVHHGIGWGTLIGIIGFLVLLVGAIFPFGIGKSKRNKRD